MTYYISFLINYDILYWKHVLLTSIITISLKQQILKTLLKIMVKFQQLFQQLQVYHELLHPFLLYVTGLFSLYFLIKWLTRPGGNKRSPPSPPKIPILGNLHQISPLVYRSFRSLGTKYGPNMLLHFGKRPVFVVQTYEAAIEILKTHDLVFANKPTTGVAKKLFYNFKDVAIAPYGEYWRKMKSIFVVQLLSSKRVQSFNLIREEETALLSKNIGSCSSSGLPVNLSELFFSLTNDILCRSAFGRKYSKGGDGKHFLMLLKELMQLMGNPSIGEYVPYLSWINRFNGFDAKVDSVAKEIDDFLESVVDEHLNSGQERGDDDERKGTFVDILLQIYKENVIGVSIDRDNIKAIILDLFAGGTDTTAANMEWTMAELLRHPIVMKKLQNEVRDIIKEKECITETDLGKMHYLKAVVKESLRCHLPVPYIGREPSENVKVMGYDIAAGTMVLINVWAICNDPTFWDEPEKFNPERFMNSSVNFKGQDFEFIPFGTGRRYCPGVAFAMASVELVLANLVNKFDWELPDGKEGENLDMTEQPGVTIHRKNPLFAVAKHFE